MLLFVSMPGEVQTSEGRQSLFVETQSVSAELPHPFHRSPRHQPLVLLSSVGTAGKMANFVCPGLKGGVRAQSYSFQL